MESSGTERRYLVQYSAIEEAPTLVSLISEERGSPSATATGDFIAITFFNQGTYFIVLYDVARLEAPIPPTPAALIMHEPTITCTI